MKRGWGQRGTLAVEMWNIFSMGSRERRGGEWLTDSLNDWRAESNFDVLGSERGAHIFAEERFLSRAAGFPTKTSLISK